MELKQIQEQAIRSLKFKSNIRAKSIVREHLKLAYEQGRKDINKIIKENDI